MTIRQAREAIARGSSDPAIINLVQAEEAKIAAQIASITARHDLAPLLTPPKQATPFVPTSEVVSETTCWVVRLIDLKGRRRTGFLRGPYHIQMAYQHANASFRNWTIINLEPTEETTPPPGAKPQFVPAEAHQFGVLKTLHSRRLR